MVGKLRPSNSQFWVQLNENKDFANNFFSVSSGERFHLGPKSAFVIVNRKLLRAHDQLVWNNETEAGVKKRRKPKCRNATIFLLVSTEHFELQCEIAFIAERFYHFASDCIHRRETQHFSKTHSICLWLHFVKTKTTHTHSRCRLCEMKAHEIHGKWKKRAPEKMTLFLDGNDFFSCFRARFMHSLSHNRNSIEAISFFFSFRLLPCRRPSCNLFRSLWISFAVEMKTPNREDTKWEKVWIFMLEFKYDFIHFHIIFFSPFVVVVVVLAADAAAVHECAAHQGCVSKGNRALCNADTTKVTISTWVRERKCNEVCKLNLLQLQ